MQTYHYGDQGICDHGWGCSYRNAQTVASAMRAGVPTLPEMLSLFNLEKVYQHGGKRLWIEPPQVARVLRVLCSVDCTTLVFARSKGGLREFERRYMLRSTLDDFDSQLEGDREKLLSRVRKHFKDSDGLPVIIDDGIYSFVLIPGTGPDALLLVDPHVERGLKACVRPFQPEELFTKSGWMILFPRKDVVSL